MKNTDTSEVILPFLAPALVAQMLRRDRYGEGSAPLFCTGLVPSMDEELSWNTNTSLCRHAGDGQKACTGVTTLPDSKTQLQSTVSQNFFNKVIGNFVLNRQNYIHPQSLVFRNA